MRRALQALLLVPGLAWAAAPLSVHATHAQRASYRPATPVFARVHGPEHALIQAPYDAVMGPLVVAPGTAVAAGAVIARLLPMSLAGTVRALEAQTEAARATYEQARVLARQGVVTPAHARGLKARWQADVANLQADGARLARGTVRAPFAGTVRYQAAPGAWLARGANVVAIGGAGGLYEACSLTVREADRLYVGARVRRLADQGRVRAPAGRVYALSARTDDLGLVRAYVRGVGGGLRPGQVVRLDLLSHRRTAIMVPRAALLIRHGRARVFVVVGGRAQPVAVNVLRIGARRVFVAGSLARGAVVIDSGVARLRAGLAVRVVR
ncbi:MAG: efflux RND transporter periplasmic adaptor subunit [Acidiferrobacter sp.]